PFTVDVRVIAATNHDLEAAIAKSQFREDLYYRLNVVPIHVPPLRERSEDVAVLVREFAEAFRKENNARARGFTPAALERLTHLPWTGNVRELKNAVERVLILSDADQIDVKDLERVLEPASGAPRRPEVAGGEGALAASARGAGYGGPGGGPGGFGGSAAAGGPVSPSSYASLQGFKDAAERAYIVQKLREN